jgi:hypothetical protein
MKRLPIGERAIAALVRYERAAAELARIKKGIVTTLEKCPTTIEAYENNNLNCDFLNVREEDHERLWDGSRVRHHLHEVLQLTYHDGGEYDPERKLDDYEIRAALEGYSEDESQPYKCEHCLAAWLLVERRKLARREFGCAKRTVRAIGKTAIKQATPLFVPKPCAAHACECPRVGETIFCGAHQSARSRLTKMRLGGYEE